MGTAHYVPVIGATERGPLRFDETSHQVLHAVRRDITGSEDKTSLNQFRGSDPHCDDVANTTQLQSV